MAGQKILLKETTKTKKSREESEVSTKNKCPECGTPYKITSVPIDIDSIGVHDIKYFEKPACDCIQKRKDREFKKTEGQKLVEKIRRLKRCGIPPIYQGKSFSNFDRSLNKAGYDKCKNFVKKFGTGSGKIGLFITGLVGTGKTHLASAIADHMARIGYRKINNSIVFCTVSDLIDGIRRSKDPYSVWDRIDACDLLILDDLGAEYITQWSKKVIQKVIDNRYRSKKATVITTNLSLEGVKTEYDERVSSRICGMCQAVVLEGEDYRLIKSSENKLF